MRRSEQLIGLAEALEREAEPLARALVRDIEITIRSARERDIRLAAYLLREYAAQPERELRPLGKAAVFLPYNAVSLCGAMAVGAAFLAGNEVLVKLPSRLATFAPLYRELLERTLPGVAVSRKPGHEFLWECFGEPAVGAVMCFGDHHWMMGYEAQVRYSRKKVIFEGPGNSPFLVLADADVGRAARAAVDAGFANSGQSCAAPARFYVAQEVLEGFVAAVLEHVAALKVGPPEAETTDIGPLGSENVVGRLRRQLEDARRRGAKIVTGGEIVRQPGTHYDTCLPTVVTHCHQEMLIVREEKFAPVMPIVAVTSAEEALALAEDSDYGLTATLFGGNEVMAERLRYSHGNVFHDSSVMDTAHRNARLHWGGFRNSGWVWEWCGYRFARREGPRALVEEFSAGEAGVPAQPASGTAIAAARRPR